MSRNVDAAVDGATVRERCAFNLDFKTYANTSVKERDVRKSERCQREAPCGHALRRSTRVTRARRKYFRKYCRIPTSNEADIIYRIKVDKQCDTLVLN